MRLAATQIVDGIVCLYFAPTDGAPLEHQSGDQIRARVALAKNSGEVAELENATMALRAVQDAHAEAAASLVDLEVRQELTQASLAVLTTEHEAAARAVESVREKSDSQPEPAPTKGK